MEIKTTDPAQDGSCVWWVLGIDTSGAWHERVIRGGDESLVSKWWKERAGREPDVCWEARHAIDRISMSRVALNKWPSMPGIAPPRWFLGWLSRPSDQKMTLLSVPAADARHAFWLLQHENPACHVKIIGETSPLDDVFIRLRDALGGVKEAIDEDVTIRPDHLLSAAFSNVVAQQFEMEPSE